jgi:hypothetical protein
VKHTSRREENHVLFVGWGWADETHDVSVLDQEGNLLDRWALRHDEQGIDAGLAQLVT